MITAKMRIAIIQKATETPNAKQVYKEINEAVGRVSYATVLKVIKAAGIDLTKAASERLKRRNAERTKRLHTDPRIRGTTCGGVQREPEPFAHRSRIRGAARGGGQRAHESPAC